MYNIQNSSSAYIIQKRNSLPPTIKREEKIPSVNSLHNPSNRTNPPGNKGSSAPSENHINSPWASANLSSFFLFFFVRRRSYQYTRVAWTSVIPVKGYTSCDVIQVSVASQTDEIARRFLLYRSFWFCRMRPFGLGSDILIYYILFSLYVVLE